MRRTTHQVRMMARLECHDGPLGRDYDPSTNQPSHLLHDHVVLKLLYDLTSQIFNSNVVAQQVSPQLQWLDSSLNHSVENHNSI